MQSAVPQAQVAVLAAEPFVTVQDVYGLQVFASQNSPLDAVQLVAPHKQASVFSVPPLVFVHPGAAMHRHERWERKPHDVVEVDSVL